MTLLETAIEKLHVATAQAYREKQIRYLRKTDRVPQPAGTLDAYVVTGVWRVRCACNEAPSTHPDWQIACCLGCGALYDVTFPYDRAAIETVLMARPQRRRRWQAPTTLEQLIAEDVT